MEDWLVTFGTFQENLPEGIGADNYYLPTNSKSLVVSHPESRYPRASTSWFHALFDRYPFSRPELSLVRFSRSLWVTLSVVNGGLSHHALFSVLALVCNSIPVGQLLS